MIVIAKITNGHINNKWKDYSIKHHLSDSGDNETTVGLYDYIAGNSVEDVEGMFKATEVIVWGAYARLDMSDLADNIIAMAEDLQYLAEQE